MHPRLTHHPVAKRNRRSERAITTYREARRAVSLIAFAACLFGGGCSDPTVWKAQLPSSDGAFVAIAQTAQNGGFGTAGIDTSVYIKSTHSSNSPIQVLGFSCDGPVSRPYVLDNVANAGGTINLTMTWLSPSHLQITYKGHPNLYLEMAKIWGVDISAKDLSAESQSKK